MTVASAGPRNPNCTNPDCPAPAWARGLCSRHYQAEYRRRGPPCSRRGCSNPSFARGLCVRHYQQQYRTREERCRKRNCPNAAFSRGLCVKHYHRWYRRLLREHGVASIKALPREVKDRIPGVRR